MDWCGLQALTKGPHIHLSCRYALTGKEVVSILMQRLVKVDGKVRTDCTYPAGFMDVIEIDRTDEHFRLIYDTKGRFVTHRITKVGLKLHAFGGIVRGSLAVQLQQTGIDSYHAAA